MWKPVVGSVCLAGLLLLHGCASAPRQSGALPDSGPEMQVVKQARHVRIAVGADRAALAAARSAGIPQVSLATPMENRGISDNQLALLANAAGREACRELAQRFEILPDSTQADLQLKVRLTAVRSSSALASGVSALAGFVVPGPSRLPIGLGGLAAQASATASDGQPLLAYEWARGARSVAENPSLSRIGDAYQLARLLGREVAREVVDWRGPRALRRERLSATQRRASLDLCTLNFGADPWLGRGIGMFLPLAPEAVDSGRPSPKN